MSKRFENAQVGDKVYCLIRGEGEVDSADYLDGNSQIVVNFYSLKNEYVYYFTDGRHSKNDANPILYWSKPEIIGGTEEPVRTSSIGGYEYPKAESVKPEDGTPYHTPVIVASGCYAHVTTWEDSTFDIINLDKGYVHLSRDNAIKHAEAMAKALSDLKEEK